MTAVAGIQVTDVARTALDPARSLLFEPAVVVIDAALHEGLLTTELIEGGCSTSPGPVAAGTPPGSSGSPTVEAKASARAGVA